MTDTEKAAATVSENASNPELAQKIVKQVEYYFGDINLPRDKFIQEEMKKDDGWIPLTTMLKFNRLSTISKDVYEIASALKDSSLIEVSEDSEKIRRNPEVPLPDNTLEYWQEIKRRTVYVKGFPLETPLDEILEFVGQHGNVKNVLMRRTKPGRVFKGSIFATFADREAAEKFAKNADVTEFKGSTLIKMMQDEYWVRKNKENKERRQAEKNIKNNKKQQAIDEQQKSVHAAQFVKGTVLNVEGLPTDGKTSLKKLKDFFSPYAEVAWVVYADKSDKAQIRFTSKEGIAQKAWDAATAAGENGKVLFEGSELSGSVLEGDEEEKYWLEFTKSKVARNEHSKGGRSFGKRRPDKRPAPRNGDGDAKDGGSKKPKRTVFKDEDDEDTADKKETAAPPTEAAPPAKEEPQAEA